MCFTPIHQVVCLTWYHWTMSLDGGPSQIVGWQKNREFVKLGICWGSNETTNLVAENRELGRAFGDDLFFHKVVTGENLV